MSEMDPSPEAAAAPATVPARDAYAVLRNRDLVLYLLARFISSFGQQMLTVAVGWEIYKLTNSALALGLVGLTQMVPMLLFTLPAGQVADNHERKRIIILMTLVLAVASLGLTLISAFQAPVYWIYACLFLAGTARTFLWPASSAFLPHLVSREEFARAVTWSSGSFQLSSVLGPALCGGLLALTHHAAPIYAFNAAAALACVAMIACVRRQHVVAAKEKMNLWTLMAGFQFVFASPIIVGTLSLDLFAVLLGGATSLLPIYAKDILQGVPLGFGFVQERLLHWFNLDVDVAALRLGFLQAALPLGSLLCVLVLAHRPPLRKAGRAMLWAVACFGLATIAFGYSKWFWFSFLMLFVCGAVDNVSIVVRHTLVQLLTPDEKRGRVSAVNSLFIGTSNELGGFESGLVAYLFTPVVSVVAGGIGTIVVVIAVAAIWPQLPKYGRLE
jgi:MFS family permease